MAPSARARLRRPRQRHARALVHNGGLARAALGGPRRPAANAGMRLTFDLKCLTGVPVALFPDGVWPSDGARERITETDVTFESVVAAEPAMRARFGLTARY
jgi:hypothetical protein